MKKDNTEKAQKSVLDSIIGRGTKFAVTYTKKTQERGFLGIRKQTRSEQVTEEFTIDEPTLAVLDRMSEIWLTMDIPNIEEMEAGEIVALGYGLAHKHAKDMAKVLAIAVLNERYYALEDGDAEVERLTDLFFRTTKPSQLPQVAMAINATSHIADFMASMRMMKMSTTTKPTKRIE